MLSRSALVAVAMAMTMAEVFPASPGERRRHDEEPNEPSTEEKEAQMRRELAEVQGHRDRLRAAAEKRARKAAKRAKDMKAPNAIELTGAASPRPNDRRE